MEEDRIKKEKRVLLVDDDQFLLNMYSIKFKSSGFVAEIANNGNEALNKLRNGLDVDAIVFDVVMPNMDGLEFLRSIKKEKLAPNAVYIALTNQGQSTDVEEAKKIGVHGYIVKASAIPSEVVQEVSKIMRENKPLNYF